MTVLGDGEIHVEKVSCQFPLHLWIEVFGGRLWFRGYMVKMIHAEDSEREEEEGCV